MAWFRMPMSVFRSYLRMHPRLRAETSLQNVSETMLGTGNMEQKAAERALNDWQREAEGPRKKRKPLTREEHLDALKATGWFEVEAD